MGRGRISAHGAGERRNQLKRKLGYLEKSFERYKGLKKIKSGHNVN